MGPDNGSNVVFLEELFHGLHPVEVRTLAGLVVREPVCFCCLLAVGVLLGCLLVIVARVRPKQITHWPVAGSFFKSVDIIDFDNRSDIWRETTMNAEEGLLVLAFSTGNNSSEGKTVEGFHNGVVNCLAVFVQTFVLEVKVSRQLSTLVITTQHGERLAEAELHTEEVYHDFGRETTAVDIIPQKKICRGVGISSIFPPKQTIQIEELAVNIPTNCNGNFKMQHVWLIPEHILGAADDLEVDFLLQASFFKQMFAESFYVWQL
mmetsp:Transcript_20142/g.31969  ORF Transcript_20142/g.31969 Transcript_20142/m.31969 type:complete len:263 (-) Transcript_20142:167-955(-)